MVAGTKLAVAVTVRAWWSQRWRGYLDFEAEQERQEEAKVKATPKAKKVKKGRVKPEKTALANTPKSAKKAPAKSNTRKQLK